MHQATGAFWKMDCRYGGVEDVNEEVGFWDVALH